MARDLAFLLLGDVGGVIGGMRSTQGLKKQLKRLKAAYEAASTIQKINQEHQRTMSWEAEGPGAGGRGDVGGGVGIGGGVNVSVSSAAGIASVASSSSLAGGAAAVAGGARSLRRRLTSHYSLSVGEDVDEVEEKFKASLDAEVCHACLCGRIYIYVGLPARFCTRPLFVWVRA